MPLADLTNVPAVDDRTVLEVIAWGRRLTETVPPAIFHCATCQSRPVEYATPPPELATQLAASGTALTLLHVHHRPSCQRSTQDGRLGYYAARVPDGQIATLERPAAPPS